MKHLIQFSILALGLCCTAIAQDKETIQNQDISSSHRRFWEASLPGGQYMVALDRIASINMHTYMMSGGITVHEININTSGNALARFYTIEIIGQNSKANIGKNLTKRGQEILGSQGNRLTGIAPNTMVEKQYPHTTHAKTIEFRLSSKADLDSLYFSIKRAWTDNRGRKFTVK